MRIDVSDTTTERDDKRAGSPHVAIGALVFAVALLASLALWVRFGEAVYIERILGAIASCL